jgi:hypothetical protein
MQIKTGDLWERSTSKGSLSRRVPFCYNKNAFYISISSILFRPFLSLPASSGHKIGQSLRRVF